jgi:hypothetical protein
MQTVKQMSYLGELAEDIVELKAEIATATIHPPPEGMPSGEMRQVGDRTGD